MSYLIALKGAFVASMLLLASWSPTGPANGNGVHGAFANANPGSYSTASFEGGVRTNGSARNH